MVSFICFKKSKQELFSSTFSLYTFGFIISVYSHGILGLNYFWISMYPRHLGMPPLEMTLDKLLHSFC